MTGKLLVGTAAIFGIAVTVSNPVMSVLLAAGVWIYVARMVSKEENIVVRNHMKTKIKPFWIVAGVSFPLFLVGAIVHNVLSGIAETDEAVFLLVSLIASLVFVVSTAGGMALFLKERQKAT